MITFRKIEKSDYQAVAEFMHQEMEQSFSPERWRQLLEYDWQPAGPDHGFVALDEKGIVGFVAAVFSAVSPKDCNLGGWCVSPRVRGKGVGQVILDEYFNRPGFRYRALTPAVYVTPAYFRMGFKAYETHRYVCGYREDGGTVNVAFDKDIREDRLTEIEARILRDHSPHRCRFALLESRGENCFVVMKDFPRKKKPGVFSEILYASDPAFFLRHPSSMNHDLMKDRDSIVAMDKRFLVEPPAHGVLEELTSPRLIHTKEEYDPLELNALYSEVVLLDVKM